MTSPRDRIGQTSNQAASTPADPVGIGSVETVVIVLLGLFGLLGICGILISFIPDVDTGQLNLTLIPACVGMIMACLSTVALLRVRNKNKPASVWLGVGLILWFVGLNILGWGGFAVMNPGEQTMAANLSISTALCFGPGGILALLGLAFYGYDYRRKRESDWQAEVGAGEMNSGVRDWAVKLERAAEYRAHITRLINQKRRSALADQLTPIFSQLKQWESHLGRLVDKVTNFETNSILQRDMRDVPAAILRLQQQLETETNPPIRAQLAETLAGYQAQQQQLNALAAQIRQIELEIEETLAEMGTIYSQLQLVGAKEVDSSRAKRLSAEIEGQTKRLNDLLAAMNEVYEDNEGKA